MDPQLQYLLDRTTIPETIVRYFNSLDARDWPAMRATLAGTRKIPEPITQPTTTQ